MTDLSGLSVIVTGAASGLGRAIAVAFAAAGARVGLLDIDEALLARVAAEHPALDLTLVRCDVSDEDAVRQEVDRFAHGGGLDILVNNAVLFHYAPLVDFPSITIDRMLNVGLKGALWATKAATPHLARSANGSILNLSSIAVSVGIRDASVYSTIKGALDGLTRQQAVELGPSGIRVNALAPGSVPTPGASKVISTNGWESRIRKTLLGRLPTPEDIAKAALFLSSAEARCITGVTLKVDSGMTIAGA